MRRLWIAWTLLLLLVGCGGSDPLSLVRITSAGAATWITRTTNADGQTVETHAASFGDSETYSFSRTVRLSTTCEVRLRVRGRFAISTQRIFFFESTATGETGVGDNCNGALAPSWFAIGTRTVAAWDTEYRIFGAQLTMRLSPEEQPMVLVLYI